MKYKISFGNYRQAKGQQTPNKQLVISVLHILCFRMMTRTLIKSATGKIDLKNFMTETNMLTFDELVIRTWAFTPSPGVSTSH